MKKQLFLSTTLIIFAGLLSFFFASLYITHNNNINIAKDTVVEKAEIFAGLFEYITDINAFAVAGGDTRITIISLDGVILADSHPFSEGSAENRLSRPEIQAAAQGLPAPSIRFSDTFGADLIYYALKIPNGDSFVFIRTAIPVAQMNTYLRQTLPLLAATLFGIAMICLFFTRKVANRIIKPFASAAEKLRLLSQGEHVSQPIQKTYYEIEDITKKIDDIALILQGSFDALRDEKNKLSYILNNIGDGLFVVDEAAVISLVNSSALNIFNAAPDIKGKKLNYMISDKVLTDEIEDCINNSKNSLLELALNGKTYITTIKRLPDTKQTMVALVDITESRENSKRREDFFANASHELKTPLTAIKVFNDLTALNNKDSSISKHINGIACESDRMMLLINNMLKLSELENTATIEPVSISLNKIVSEVLETVSAAFKEKSITFETKGDAIVASEPEHIYELVKNLIENAARYNNQGGKVFVTIKSHKKFARLTVSDNGIGISPEEQTRIFERFYRVEKSRSVKSGGTGLGLSIVKHICALYGWNLSLKSKFGVGTDVAVDFKFK